MNPSVPFIEHTPTAAACGVVLSSPHSGDQFPPDFLRHARLSERALRSSEDAFVHELFADAPTFGAVLLQATQSRAVIDLNRDPADLDPAIIAGAKTAGVNPRVSAGLGVIPRVVAHGQPIRNGKITLAEANDRLRRFHAPYHTRLAALLEARRRMFGEVLLLDCHSMPHAAVSNLRDPNGAPEIVLGDAHGVACTPALADRVEALFAEAGFRVRRNVPFSGGYITRHYGRPGRGIQALQIEINRGLYMNERRISKAEGFTVLKARLYPVLRQICAIPEQRANALAAE